MIAFGPSLIGQTEKSLDALLGRVLSGRDLSTSQWVTLRLAGSHVGAGDLVSHVRDRAQFDDAADLVAGLEGRGLIASDRLTARAEEFVAEISADIAALTGPIWRGLDAADVSTTERVLNSVLDQVRARL